MHILYYYIPFTVYTEGNRIHITFYEYPVMYTVGFMISD